MIFKQENPPMFNSKTRNLLTLVFMAVLASCGTRTPVHPLGKDHSLIVRTLCNVPTDEWQLVDSIPLKFNTYHPQGMLKVDNEFYLSSVQVEQRPRYTRKGKEISVQDEGAGKGHLFHFDCKGNLLHDIEVGEGTLFHPGGIDFDGQYIWIPITKYYPYSRSLIVRMDVQTHEVVKVGYIDDSVGAIVYDSDDHTLTGANWNADEFLTWQLNEKLKIVHPELPAEQRRTPNAAKHLAIQDSKYLGNHLLIGFGLKSTEKGSIGGFDLIDTRTLKQVHVADILQRTPKHRIPITSNPSTLEVTEDCLRMYFAPEDNRTTVYIYETRLQR